MLQLPNGADADALDQAGLLFRSQAGLMQLHGSRRVWVAPQGEQDPRAIRVQLEGRSLPAESLLKRYLPKV